jgi:hypothetical protein
VLNALDRLGVHVFTANDYLACRDAEWMGAVYRFLGLKVGAVRQGMSREERRRAYAADVTYVTAKEAGFDFLRDHTADSPSQVVQRPFRSVIVDEADFILIDEARVPLVIAGMTAAPDIDHQAIASLVRTLDPGVDYRIDEYARNVALTDTGVNRVETLLGLGALHEPGNRLLLAAVHVALHAETLLQRDRDYIVRDGRVELVDEFTGRVADNRRWPHGIQPAVEEFKAFYGLSTVVFPPNRPCRRVDEPDVVFSGRNAKLAALRDEIEPTACAEGAPEHYRALERLVGPAVLRRTENRLTLHLLERLRTARPRWCSARLCYTWRGPRVALHRLGARPRDVERAAPPAACRRLPGRPAQPRRADAACGSPRHRPRAGAAQERGSGGDGQREHHPQPALRDDELPER